MNTPSVSTPRGKISRFRDGLVRGFWTAVFAYASIIEWTHFRRALDRRDLVELWAACTAAVACGYIASESMEGNWP